MARIHVDTQRREWNGGGGSRRGGKRKKSGRIYRENGDRVKVSRKLSVSKEKFKKIM